MKTSARSESGFVKMALIFGCVIILLFGMGAQGIYTAIKNRNPAVMSCEQFVANKPKAAWLGITNCVLDLNDARFQVEGWMTEYGIEGEQVFADVQRDTRIAL